MPTNVRREVDQVGRARAFRARSCPARPRSSLPASRRSRSRRSRPSRASPRRTRRSRRAARRAREPGEGPARTTSLPFRDANGAIRANSPYATANASPRSIHVSRPKAAIPNQAQYAVERDGERERPRVAGSRVRELERGEAEEQHRPRASAPIRSGRTASGAPRARFLVEPDRRVRDRAPRAQRPPDVPEQQRQRHGPEPEDDVDERRREVLVRGSSLRSPRMGRSRRTARGDQAEDDAQHP